MKTIHKVLLLMGSQAPILEIDVECPKCKHKDKDKGPKGRKGKHSCSECGNDFEFEIS
jgi:transposase-like protein